MEAQDALEVVGEKDDMKRIKQWDMLSKKDVQSVLKSFQTQVDKALSILFCPHSSLCFETEFGLQISISFSSLDYSVVADGCR